MKRDAKRVANLIHQLDEDGVYYPGMERFKEDISSDLGSREYFTPVGLGTPPTLQYLVINIGSDVGGVPSPTGVKYSPLPKVERVANLIHQLDEDGVYYPGMERFKEDISSDLGSREYFTPVGLGTPPTLQYLVINIGSDVGGLVCVSTSGTFGSLVLGREGIPTCAAWASLLSNKQAPSFYYIELVGLGAESIRLPISEDVFQISKSGHGGVIMDMGTKTCA
nr:protein aspartic protease in guard cell 2 [Quercus suber]